MKSATCDHLWHWPELPSSNADAICPISARNCLGLSCTLCGRWNAEVLSEGEPIFRVSQSDDASGTIVTIEGPLTGEYVGVAEQCGAQAMATGKRVSLLLRDVPEIDEAGKDLLCRLAKRGVRLLGSGAYALQVIEVLQDARKTKKAARAARGESRRA